MRRSELNRSGLALLLMMSVLLMGCGSPTGLAIAEERVAPNEADIEREMIKLIRDVSLERRDASEDGLVRRFNQPKTIACLQGEMTVRRLEPRLAVGLFAEPASYPVTVRFANATQLDDREADLRGLSIRVTDVAGAQSVDGGVGVQEFTLNSYPVLFAGTPAVFLDFVRATAADRLVGFFLNPFDAHLKSLWIVLRARDNPTSPLAVRYFSTTPYAHGGGAAVKYSVRSCSALAASVAVDDADYLRGALARDLNEGAQCLEFMAQFQSDPDLMPLEDASVVWPEDVSPFVTLAKLVFEAQPFTGPGALEACEAMRFNPWNGLAAHRPLGGINRVRRQLYHEIGAFRTAQNAAP